MGIPTFFKWLTVRFPQCVKRVVEDRKIIKDGPVDVSATNPNDVEFDNLYLDMNGIIHPCFHPEGLDSLECPKNYEEIFKAIFVYIDRVLGIVRPRKLLYIAIDGVAPRAKMNQQRSRRFKAAKEAADNVLRKDMEEAFEPEEKSTELNSNDLGNEMEEASESEEESTRLDSNVITPGTEFMEILSSVLRYYINLRMNEDKAWRGLKVIFSDASVPGEGEHKIMSFIRLQRNLPGYDPNTRHCLYGLDADLILLALSTHELHISILREDTKALKNKRKEMRRQMRRLRIRGIPKKVMKMEEIVSLEHFISTQKFLFVHIWVLRKYLELDLRISDSKVKTEAEHLIDDFVLMCVFVGNDFLPHIPSLKLCKGGLNMLMMIYKRDFVQRGGFLTNGSEVYLDRVMHLLHSAGTYERTLLSTKKNAMLVKKKVCSPEVSGWDWKDQYYANKFAIQTSDELQRIKKDAVLKYVEGICWVMRYYYQEVCSWQWFYPYHYAPLASDFVDIDQLKIQFTLGEPLKPLDQLMGVLPAASAHALPISYRKLMTDISSRILEFYPTDFEIDMDEARFPWQGVCKLPFIDESRLLSAIAEVEHTLTDEEKRRNTPGLDILFVHASHPLAGNINSDKQTRDQQNLNVAEMEQKIDPVLSGGLNGYFYISDKPICPLQIPSLNMNAIAQNEVISVFYKCPSFHPHVPRPLEGAILPEQYLNKMVIVPLHQIWRTKSERNSFRSYQIYTLIREDSSLLFARSKGLRKELLAKVSWERKNRFTAKPHMNRKNGTSDFSKLKICANQKQKVGASTTVVQIKTELKDIKVNGALHKNGKSLCLTNEKQTQVCGDADRTYMEVKSKKKRKKAKKKTCSDQNPSDDRKSENCANQEQKVGASTDLMEIKTDEKQTEVGGSAEEKNRDVKSKKKRNKSKKRKRNEQNSSGVGQSGNCADQEQRFGASTTVVEIKTELKDIKVNGALYMNEKPVCLTNEKQTDFCGNTDQTGMEVKLKKKRKKAKKRICNGQNPSDDHKAKNCANQEQKVGSNEDQTNREQTEVGGDADQPKMEVKSKIKRKKSKKRKCNNDEKPESLVNKEQGESGGGQLDSCICKELGAATNQYHSKLEVKNSDEYMENCLDRKQSVKDAGETKTEVNKTVTESVSHNNAVKSVVNQGETDISAGVDGAESKTEVRSKKKRKRKSMQGINNGDIAKNSIEKPNICFGNQQSEYDGGRLGAGGDGIALYTDEKVDSGIIREQNGVVGHHGCLTGIGNAGETKTEVKKMDRESVRHSKGENLRSAVNMDHDITNNASHPESSVNQDKTDVGAGSESKTEVRSKKKRKRKGGIIIMEQNGVVDHHANAAGICEIMAEVKSCNPLQVGCLPINSLKESEPSALKEQKNASEGNLVNQEMKAEVGPERKKRKRNKKKQSEKGNCEPDSNANNSGLVAAVELDAINLKVDSEKEMKTEIDTVKVMVPEAEALTH